MNLSKYYFGILIVALMATEACKTKKMVQKPVVKTDTVKAVPVVAVRPKPTPKPTPKDTTHVAPPASVADNSADYNFHNIQFEFNSGILKTDSYPILDNAAAAMKADQSVKFILKGYASAEGTDEHNMQLSIERAAAVKGYLVNSGINPDNLSTKGFGEANPVADNNTDAGRVLNRRVEIRKLK
jgi:OmpA-OmpF porin, OOP family